MSDVLSQSEIDELLSALSSGEILPEQVSENKDKHQVKKYDFRSPKKFSKEHIRTLEMVFESYARIIASFLSAQIRTNVQVKVAVIEQVTYEEFIRSVSTPTVLTIYKMPPFTGSLMFETGPQFVFQIVDILFGGSGNAPVKAREFTEIEKNVITNINAKLIENLKLAWEDILDVEPEVQGIETNPALNQTMAPNEPVALIALSIKINNIQSYINLCIPYLAIEKVMDKLVIKYWFNAQEGYDAKAARESIERKVQGVPMNITVVLGRTEIPIRTFLDLQAGDVIRLDSSVEENIEVFIEDRLHYKALPGNLNKKKAVRIMEIIDKDVDKNE